MGIGISEDTVAGVSTGVLVQAVYRQAVLKQAVLRQAVHRH